MYVKELHVQLVDESEGGSDEGAPKRSSCECKCDMEAGWRLSARVR